MLFLGRLLQGLIHWKVKVVILTADIYYYLGLIFKVVFNDLETKAVYNIYCLVLQTAPEL